MDPVIVVGAGPVGLTLSLALAAQGVPCVLLDEGPGTEEVRLARTVVLREDTADLVGRLGAVHLEKDGLRWSGWRSMRRKQLVRDVPLGPGHDGSRDAGTSGDVRDVGDFGDADVRSGPSLSAPLHIPQHALASALRAAVAAAPLVELVPLSRVDTLEQDRDGVTVHTKGPGTTWWRGSYLVGCDGARSTVRKLLDIRFPGRTAVERHAVAALRAELPWPGEAVLHRQPPWRGGGAEVSARPLPDGVWRLDWLLPPRG
ncbi:FAD-dependent monooxygenase, partial [Streptomyces sp. SID2119]|uniref:FAD-dependent monooxygenase n=1 Tax=Streptomyces sp. SID2119 TaxID=2690253 RepID=UPI00139B8F65|nr:monooxygenase [Streptomyces sp. SID2119]